MLDLMFGILGWWLVRTEMLRVEQRQECIRRGKFGRNLKATVLDMQSILISGLVVVNIYMKPLLDLDLYIRCNDIRMMMSKWQSNLTRSKIQSGNSGLVGPRFLDYNKHLDSRGIFRLRKYYLYYL